MTNRDEQLTSMRPSIEVNLDENPENSPGHFQNATLRPILKSQNRLLLQIFRNYLQKVKANFKQLTPPKQQEFIANSIRNDLRLRNMLIGSIIGHFTEKEWEIFAQNEQELTRRIADLLIKRLSDQAEKLVV